MKITRITPYLVERCLIVRVHTDAGIVGTGEGGLWPHHRLVYEAINDLADYYVGRDAGLIEHHFQAVTRDTHFSGAALSAALSAIDIALWDILGKSVGKSVAALLGGKVRDKVRVFANASGDSPAAFAASARAAVERGYTALRAIPFPVRLGGAHQQAAPSARRSRSSRRSARRSAMRSISGWRSIATSAPKRRSRWRGS